MASAPKPHVLREYAFIADGERGAVVGPDGSIVWLCVPAWDSPAVFTALIGGRGSYAVTPADPRYVWAGYHEPGTLIWRGRWVSRSVTECREALGMPADPHRCVILRRVEALAGPTAVKVALDLRAGFGKQPMTNIKGNGVAGLLAAARSGSAGPALPARLDNERGPVVSQRCESSLRPGETAVGTHRMGMTSP